MASAKVYKNFIGGEWVEARTGKTFENQNPADIRDVVGIFQASGKADVDDAVAAAKAAFERWRLTLEGTNLTDQRPPVSASEFGSESFYLLPARALWLRV